MQALKTTNLYKTLSISKTNIIYLTIFFSFFLDIVNNYMLTVSGTNYGLIQIGKTSIMIVLIVMMRNKSFLLGFFSLIFIFIIRQTIIVIMGQTLVIFDDLVVFSRFILMYLYLGVFYQYKHTNLVTKVSKLYMFVCSVQAISIILGYVLKIDFLKAYEYREGYKGIFFGINDVAFFMAMAYLHAFILLLWRKNILYFSLITIAMFILGLGSRAALMSVFIVPYVYWFFTILRSKNALKKLLNVFSQIFVISVTILYLKDHYNEILLKYFSQSIMVYENTGSAATAFFSMRNEFIGDYFESLKNMFQFLFGLQLHSLREMIESDIFDFLMRIGIVGTVIYLMLIFRATKTKSSFAKPSLFSLYFIILLLGGFMGHVLLSSINAPWIAFLLILYSNKFEESIKVSK